VEEKLQNMYANLANGVGFPHDTMNKKDILTNHRFIENL
jgi:hypothetical protein